jgi:hypothetical protein
VAPVERSRVRFPWIPFDLCIFLAGTIAISGWVLAMAPYSSWTRAATKRQAGADFQSATIMCSSTDHAEAVAGGILACTNRS